MSEETRASQWRRQVLDDIAEMMGEFVDNWPQPKKISPALALIAKTMRAALDPPRHKFWGAGEADCPREIKAGNGELHTLRCKVCGKDNPEDWRCLNGSAAALCTEAEVRRIAQIAQDHMEQFHGICLRASEWDALVAAIRTEHTRQDTDHAG